MFAKKKEGQRFMILISSGTCDATKVHVAVTNGFAQLKGDATTKVDFVLMAEGGWVVEDKVLRSIGAFGLPPMSKLLDDPVMQDEIGSPGPSDPSVPTRESRPGAASALSPPSPALPAPDPDPTCPATVPDPAPDPTPTLQPWHHGRRDHEQRGPAPQLLHQGGHRPGGARNVCKRGQDPVLLDGRFFSRTARSRACLGAI